MSSVKLSDESFWRQHPTNRIYPWHHWFDGQTWVLTQEDFDGTMAAFRARLYYQAREMGYRLRTRLIGDELYIQARGQDGSALS